MRHNRPACRCRQLRIETPCGKEITSNRCRETIGGRIGSHRSQPGDARRSGSTEAMAALAAGALTTYTLTTGALVRMDMNLMKRVLNPLRAIVALAVLLASGCTDAVKPPL